MWRYSVLHKSGRHIAKPLVVPTSVFTLKKRYEVRATQIQMGLLINLAGNFREVYAAV